MRAPRLHPSTWVSLLAYALLSLAIFVEKFGRTTTDTRLNLTEEPIDFLVRSLTLWNPRTSLGELQNQAYGYLFPQGLFFAGAEAAAVPGWVAERLWSILLLIVACEGMRRVAKAMDLAPWGAVAAGFFYGLNPRIVSELGVRSAEILPAAVIPWALLPVVHVATGRLAPHRGALLSAAGFAFVGGVNATASMAPVALVAIFVVWTVWRRRARWTFLVSWTTLVGAVSLWWVTCLLILGRYSPPFFDYVEDAPTTTQTTGFGPTLRGGSNWVNYITVGRDPWWPAGYEASFEPWVVGGSALVAALALIGLARYRGPFRGPLLVAAVLGLVSLTIAHTGALTSPLGPTFQALLDGALAPLRNVHKAEPILRVPLAFGLGTLLVECLAVGGRVITRVGARAVPILVAVSLLGMALPILQGNLRTPGWNQIPDYWSQSAAYVDEHSDGGAAWIVPGSGFGIQHWGWTMEEPMEVLGSARWVTRSQVPLTPASTIRMLDSLESYLESGIGSPYLGQALERIGISHIVVRHDLDSDVTESTTSPVVSLALARSSGIERVATFGEREVGPAVEVYEVSGGAPRQFRIRDTEEAVTVASGVEDAMAAVGVGLVDPDQAMVVQGDSGWSRPADVVGDGFRDRERNFGRVHDAEGAVLASWQDASQDRVVRNYPGASGAAPVRAEYTGLSEIRASTSLGEADVVGSVHPENAPFAALDDSPATRWRSAYFTEPRRQWIEIRLDRERAWGKVTVTSPTSDHLAVAVSSWRVVAGGVSVTADADESGVTTIDLEGARSRTLRLEVADVPYSGSEGSSIAVTDIDVEGMTFERTMVLPDVEATDTPDYVFTAVGEARSCIPTLLGPDCRAARGRMSEESTGLDRTFTVSETGEYDLSGLVVARARPGTLGLLDPLNGLIGTGSSTFGNEPAVSPRMAYDADPTTSWIAGAGEERPTLTLTWPRKVRIDRIGVGTPAAPGVRPTHAILRAGGERREVDLRGYGVFAPLRARKVQITLLRKSGQPGPIGLSELHLSPTKASVPLDGAGRTGSVCGWGPVLDVDGEKYATRVDGFMGDVVSGGSMALHPCDGPIRLSAGRHRVRLTSTEQFQPTSLVLEGRDTSTTRAVPSRTLTVEDVQTTHQSVRLSDGEEAILSTTRNFNEGWVATLDGEELEPLEVDGWSQGWVVPAGSSGLVQIRYAPQEGYRIGLFGGLGLMVLVLVSALGVGVRTRLRPATAWETSGPRRISRRWRRLMAAVAILAAWLLGGLVVAAGALVGLVLVRRPMLLVAIASLALGAGALFALIAARDLRYPPDSADLCTGFAVGALLWTAWFAPERDDAVA